jgi:hypothetical protein
MEKYKVKVDVGNGHPEPGPDAESPDVSEEHAVEHSAPNDDFTAKAVTIGAVVVVGALIEVALVPPLLIGAAAALTPNYLPKLGDRLQPLFRSTVRGAYKLGRKAHSAVSDVHEQMNDIAAEVQAEENAKAAEPAAPAPNHS